MSNCLQRQTQKSAICWQTLCRCENLLEDTVSIKIIISNPRRDGLFQQIITLPEWLTAFITFLICLQAARYLFMCPVANFAKSYKHIKSVYCLCAWFQHESISWLAFYVFSYNYKTTYWKYIMLFWFSMWYFLLQEYS